MRHVYIEGFVIRESRGGRAIFSNASDGLWFTNRNSELNADKGKEETDGLVYLLVWVQGPFSTVKTTIQIKRPPFIVQAVNFKI